MSSALRDLLFRAVEDGDSQRLAEACAEHQAAIVANFPQWRTIPDDVREDPDELQKYSQGLIEIARFFDEQMGDSQLMQVLQGAAGENPLTQAEDALRAARESMNGGDYAGAEQKIQSVLDLLKPLEGPAKQDFLPICFGWLGECHFHCGRAAQSQEFFVRALTMCEATGDGGGVQAYLGSLHELYRWLGNRQESAQYAERLAEHLGSGMHADFYRARAAVVRAGEPLNRVVLHVGGRQYEVNEAANVAGEHVRFVFERNRLSLGLTGSLVDQGKALGGSGEYKGALAHFRDAQQVDPHDPDPHYQEGMALLDSGDYDGAIASYEAAERLAPGWFHVREDRWIAQQLKSGAVTPETFRIWRQLADGTAPEDEKVKLGEAHAASWPPLLLELGRCYVKLGEHEAARTHLEVALVGEVDSAHRSRILVALASADHPDSTTFLEQAAKMEQGNLVAQAMATVIMAARS